METIKPVKIINCQYQRHGQSILKIFNQAIATSTALYDYEPRTATTIQQWFKAKENKHPIIGVEDEEGTLMGFATYGSFRPWAAYKYTVEHSVYVEKAYRGRGLGKKLLQRLILLAEQENYHTLIAGIDAQNQTSIQLHQSLGFQFCGSLKQVGFKFGTWLNLEFYQLVLTTPLQPQES